MIIIFGEDLKQSFSLKNNNFFQLGLNKLAITHFLCKYHIFKRICLSYLKMSNNQIYTPTLMLGSQMPYCEHRFNLARI